MISMLKYAKAPRKVQSVVNAGGIFGLMDSRTFDGFGIFWLAKVWDCRVIAQLAQ
ncbi:MAG: hypothetical protein OXE84_10220 [Rhodobacteraceae bacterium]|nr:hypothetical protein [Paracoccaceae bacterium]MCY4196411.1 hypothetical protein [Paracoccaceae bacterium]MCY4327714.1 hypothetical protein [Paracoccaceae bacterium]